MLPIFMSSVMYNMHAQACPTLCDPHGLWPTQTPQSMRFFRQACWSGLPFPIPGDLPNPGVSCTGRQILYHWATREVHREIIITYTFIVNLFFLEVTFIMTNFILGHKSTEISPLFLHLWSFSSIFLTIFLFSLGYLPFNRFITCLCVSQNQWH